MSSRIACSVITTLVAAAGTLLFATGHASAQCQNSGGQQSGTSQTGTSQLNGLQRQGRGALQRQQIGLQNALQRQQQTALQLQAAMQQQTAALQNAVYQRQQLALQNYLMQQQAGWRPTDLSPTQDNSQVASRPRRQPQEQRVALAQPESAPALDKTDKIQPPADPSELAARQVRVARALVEDAETARQEGKHELATTLRTRAEERLQRVLGKYAGTEAADNAERILQKLR